ncbi:transcriptional regulator [Desulfocapsa sulfexigens DSM 10523]|uniref:Transcriptional regulator n=1 Tax=Desulfocapsa sulfexigens (strain DSM 10523 / SB164P1) TaxID=1167006 RepID=M1P754_DESSD|nr:LysR family transcriptional regulator [Desulfocapsa sulfexigens]AGF79308.1 transcriptional regulator [Desulfocapsa sulfexigens DSM 10523]
MSVTIRQLEIFNAVVETGQVTRAAQSLFITQSAVSLALNEMENQLGGSLFDRSGRSLELNDRGRYFLPLSREILDKLEDLDSLMNEKDGQFAGSLNLVASSTIGNYVLPYLITAFKSMHPDVHFNMLVYNTKTAEKLIIDRAVDLGFVEGEVNNEQVAVTPWFQDELVLITRCTKNTEPEEVCDVTTDIKKFKWVMREAGSGTAQIFKSKLGKYVTDLNVVMELGHTEAIKKAVEAGAGVGCLSSLTVCRAINRGWLQKIHLDGVDMLRQLYVIQHKNKAKTRLIDEFLDFCFLLSRCSEGRTCLSSPESFQDLVLQFSEKE